MMKPHSALLALCWPICLIAIPPSSPRFNDIPTDVWRTHILRRHGIDSMELQKFRSLGSKSREIVDDGVDASTQGKLQIMRDPFIGETIRSILDLLVSSGAEMNARLFKNVFAYLGQARTENIKEIGANYQGMLECLTTQDHRRRNGVQRIVAGSTMLRLVNHGSVLNNSVPSYTSTRQRDSKVVLHPTVFVTSNQPTYTPDSMRVALTVENGDNKFNAKPTEIVKIGINDTSYISIGIRRHDIRDPAFGELYVETITPSVVKTAVLVQFYHMVPIRLSMDINLKSLRIQSEESVAPLVTVTVDRLFSLYDLKTYKIYRTPSPNNHKHDIIPITGTQITYLHISSTVSDEGIGTHIKEAEVTMYNDHTFQRIFALPAADTDISVLNSRYCIVDHVWGLTVGEDGVGISSTYTSL